MFDSTTVTTNFRKGKPIEIPYCNKVKRESNHLELNSLREEYIRQQDALEAEGEILIGEGVTASWGEFVEYLGDRTLVAVAIINGKELIVRKEINRKNLVDYKISEEQFSEFTNEVKEKVCQEITELLWPFVTKQCGKFIGENRV